MSDRHDFVTGPVKREAGERPARSRRCNKGVVFRFAPLGICLGRRNMAMSLKSEDLPAEPVQK